MIHALTRLGLFFLGAGLIATAAYAKEVRPLKICTSPWPPYTTFDESTKTIAGIDSEIVRLIADRLGRTPEIHNMAWKRCLKQAENGTMDVVYSASKNNERASYMHYPETFLHDVVYVFAIRSDEKRPYKWDKNRDVTKLPGPIGVPLGFSITKRIVKEKGVIDDGALTDLTNLDKLIKGRVGSIIIGSLVLKTSLKEKGISPKLVTVLDPPYTDHGVKNSYITVSKKYDYPGETGEQLMDRINQELAQMKSSGEFERIIQKYVE